MAANSAVLFLGSNGFIANSCRALHGQALVNLSEPDTSNCFRAPLQEVYYLSLKNACTPDLSILPDCVSFVSNICRAHDHLVLVLASWPNLSSYDGPIHGEYLARFLIPLISLVTSSGKLKRIISLGTCLEYGLAEGQIGEDADCKPVTELGRVKCLLHDHLYSSEVSEIFHLRIFYPYGLNPRQGSLLDHLYQSYLSRSNLFRMSGGNQLRDFFSVDFLSSFINSLYTTDLGFRGALNIGSGSPLSVLNLLNAYCKHLNYYPWLIKGYYPMPDYEPFQFWASTYRLMSYIHANGSNLSPIHSLTFE